MIYLLTKKFGILPEETQSKIEKLDEAVLETIINEILEYNSLEDINRHLK